MATGRVPTTANSPLTAKGDLFTYSTTQARLAVGSDGDSLVADTAATTGLRYTSPVASLGNPTINGGMDVWQRGTSGFVPGNNSTTFAADRWNIARGVAGSTVSQQATGDTTNLPNIQYAMRVSRDNANTSTSAISIGSSFESVTSIPFASKAVTLTFYARSGANYSAASSALNAELRTGTGTDQNTFSTYTGSATPISSNVTLTTTWQRFALTGTVASTATEMALKFVFTPVGTAGAADYYEITGVQLDVGTWTASTAPTFRRSGGTFQGELAACQRYYVRYGGGASNVMWSGANYSTTQFYSAFQFITEMRIAPTMAVSAAADFTIFISNTSAIASAFSAAEITTKAARLALSATGLTQGNGGWVQLSGSSGKYMEASAEL